MYKKDFHFNYVLKLLKAHFHTENIIFLLTVKKYIFNIFLEILKLMNCFIDTTYIVIAGSNLSIIRQCVSFCETVETKHCLIFIYIYITFNHHLHLNDARLRSYCGQQLFVFLVLSRSAALRFYGFIGVSGISGQWKGKS